MKKVKELVSFGLKNVALPVTISAYHTHIINLEHKNQREIIDSKNKLMLEEIRKTVRDEKQKEQW